MQHHRTYIFKSNLLGSACTLIETTEMTLYMCEFIEHCKRWHSCGPSWSQFTTVMGESCEKAI